MTLIAGFQFQGVPILMGDFLISFEGEPIANLRKAHLISRNFAVGWAGSLGSAEIVLKDLFDKFNGCQVSWDKLDQFFTDYPQSKLDSLMGRLELVGWVVEGEPRCFFWTNHDPRRLSPELYRVEGSGREVFKEMIRSNPGTISGGGPEESDIESAITWSLRQVCTLISDEVQGKKYQEKGFGYAYEILYFNGERFEYVDDVLYLTWSYHFDPATGEIRDQRLHKVFYKYRTFPDYSVVKVINLEGKDHVRFSVMLPVANKPRNLDDLMNELQIKARRALPFESKYL